jgi:hypothetical protein
MGDWGRFEELGVDVAPGSLYLLKKIYLKFQNISTIGILHLEFCGCVPKG